MFWSFTTQWFKESFAPFLLCALFWSHGRGNAIERYAVFCECFSPSLSSSLAVLLLLLSKGLEITIFFYNPNIHPRKEYEIRKNENKRYALKHNIPFVDCDYDAESWFERMNGLELDPERGIRCTACFDMRMEVTAAYAAANGFVCFTTTNATSRWKDINQVNTAGLLAASHYEGLDYWVYDWQTDSMTMRKYEISVGEKFYKQEYCGCAYSLRDSNIWRKQQGGVGTQRLQWKVFVPLTFFCKNVVECSISHRTSFHRLSTPHSPGPKNASCFMLSRDPTSAYRGRRGWVGWEILHGRGSRRGRGEPGGGGSVLCRRREGLREPAAGAARRREAGHQS